MIHENLPGNRIELIIIMKYFISFSWMKPCCVAICTPILRGLKFQVWTYQTLLIQLNSWCCVTINAQTLSLFCSTGSNGTQFSLTLSVCMCSPPRLVPFQCSFNSWCSSLVPRKITLWKRSFFGKVTWNLKHSWRFLKLSSQRTPHSVVRSSRSWDLGMVSCWIFESQRFVLLNRHERFIFYYQKPSSIYKEENIEKNACSRIRGTLKLDITWTLEIRHIFCIHLQLVCTYLCIHVWFIHGCFQI